LIKAILSGIYRWFTGRIVRGFIAAGSISTGVAERFRTLNAAWQAAKERH